jgi:1-acyl-sn-glycerol-3-phosphate acyltransferase
MAIPKIVRARGPDAGFHDAGHGWDVFGLHPPTLARATAIAGPLYRRWFRVTAHGIHHVPARGAAILIANHAGALPIDAAMLCTDLIERTGRIPRIVADRFVPLLPVIGTLFSRLGVVVGTRANVRALLARGELVVIFPEGSAGIGKPFRDRYQLQAWRVGHAELALRHRAPVIPVAIIGAEESWPVVRRLPLRPFGAPFLPLPAVPVPLPVRFDLHYGAPIALHAAGRRLDADDPDDVARAATITRCAVEDLILAARRDRR